MKKFMLLGLLCIALSGCGMLGLQQGNEGEYHTPLTDTLNHVGETVGTVSKFIPGYGVLGEGVSSLILLASSGILGVLVRNRHKKAKTTENVGSIMVDAINETAKNYGDLKANVLKVVGEVAPNASIKLEEVLNEYEGKINTKKIVRSKSIKKDNEIDVLEFVRQAEKVHA